MRDTKPLLEVRNLVVKYPTRWRRPPLRAVDDVTCEIGSHETLGVVGESGSGKTTIGRAVLGLVKPTHGTLIFDGTEITNAGYRQRRALSADLQAVFQDPYSSLNPSRTIGQMLEETLRAQGKVSRSEVNDRIFEMLGCVGLPTDATTRYPRSFSGGQRQRIAIARALISRPRLVVCDEPLSALDLSVQAQILNLLRELQESFKVSFMFIAHDLTVVRHVSHRVLVLYRGAVMESGDAQDVYEHPRHPYTMALLEAAPVPDPDVQRFRRTLRATTGASTSRLALAKGCPFAGRCAFVADICREVRPELESVPPRQLVACHRWREIPTFDGLSLNPSTALTEHAMPRSQTQSLKTT